MSNAESSTDVQSVLSYMDHIAPNEYWTLLGIVAGVHDDLTTGEILQTLEAAQGDSPVWEMQGGRHATAHDILYESGIATRSEPTAEGRWHVDEEKRDLYLALGGLFGQWGLTHPNISVQTIIKYHPIKAHAPSQRLGIYRQILGYPPLDSRRPNEGSTAEIEELVNVLVSTNILRVAPQESSEPTFTTLVTPRQRDYGIERRAIVDAIASFGPGQTITLDELVNAACDLQPEIDATVIHGYILKSTTPAALKKLSLARNDAPARPSLDEAEFNPAFADPIEEMVEGVEEIVSGYGIARRVETAQEILASPEKVKALLRKWQQYSAHAKSRQQYR